MESIEDSIFHSKAFDTSNILKLSLNEAVEYIPSSSYCRDFNSIMNIGPEIRKRHFDYLIKILNEKFYPVILCSLNCS